MFGWICFVIASALPTSYSDAPFYTDYCRQAAEDSALFARFKDSDAYRSILEHLSCGQGRQFLDVILEQDPEILDRIETFRKNDSIGSPQTCFYKEVGTISPTTLRYIKVASDLKLLFGDSLKDSSIIEIGAGYGGQCAILYDLFKFKHYTIVDLPAPLALTKRFLEAMGVTNVTYKTHEESIEGQIFDLVLSNFGYTECIPEWKEKYAREILANSRRGYMTCNDEGAEKENDFNRLKRYGILFKTSIERPLTGQTLPGQPNFLLTWEENPNIAKNPGL